MKPSIPVKVDDRIVVSNLEHTGSRNEYLIGIDIPTNRLFVDVPSGPVYLSEDSDEILNIDFVVPNELGFYWVGVVSKEDIEPAMWDGTYFRVIGLKTTISSQNVLYVGEKFSVNDRSLLKQMVECQNVEPKYRGWNISKLNKIADEARKHLGLPTAREADPSLDKLLTHCENNKEKIFKALDNIRKRPPLIEDDLLMLDESHKTEDAISEANTKVSEEDVKELSEKMKELLLNTRGKFTWFWGNDWFIETEYGNFHWKDPRVNGNNTMTLFNGSYADFCKYINIDYGRDKGERDIESMCGRDFVVKIKE